MDPYIGEIRVFGFDYAPEDWAICDGKELLITDEEELYAVIGTTYGGDGTIKFKLPDLQNLVPVGNGAGPGLTTRQLNDTLGNAAVTLDYENFAPHAHQLIGRNRAGSQNRSNKPGGEFYISSPGGINLYAPITADAQLSDMKRETIGFSGHGANPRYNNQPFVSMNFCIALRGVFPSKD